MKEFGTIGDLINAYKQYHVTLISIAQKVLLKQRTWRMANI